MKFKSNVELEALSNAATDTDRFIVSDSNTLKYRTGSQVLSDIGGQASLTNPVTGTGTLNFVSKFTSTGSTLGNSVIYDNGTNVGIGTTNPSQKTTILTSNESLHDVLGVYNAVTGTSALGKGAAIRIGSSTEGAYSTKIATIYEGNNPDYLQPALAFFTMNNTYLKGSEVERMRISANGNVGIGTTTPNRKLHVESSGVIADFKSTTTQGLVDIIGTSNQLRIGTFSGVVGLAHGTGTSPHITIASGGNVGIGTTSPSAKLDVRGSYFQRPDSNTTGVWQLTDNGGTLRARFDLDSAGDSSMLLRNGSGTYTASINSDGNSYLNGGNVGIGTTSPGYKLDVNGSAQIKDYIRITNTGGAQRILLGNQDSTGVNNPSIIFAANGNTHIGGGDSWSGNGGTLNYTATFTDAGNVGIGTTSPSAKLVVQGTAGNLYIDDLGAGYNYYDASNVHNFRNTSGTSRLYINTSTGNVGIGTTSPGQLLHVNGNVIVGSASSNPLALNRYITAYSTTNGDLVGFQAYAADGTNNIRSGFFVDDTALTTTFDTGFSTGWNGYTWEVAGSEKMRLTSTGNVGIGTTDPSAKLEVRGDAPTYTNASTVFWGGTTNNDSHNGIMLSSFGDALGGSLSSNLLYSNSNTPTQTNTNRSSGQIKFENTTIASKTSDINFGGYYKGTTTFIERMRINSDGNVGIGTTSPGATLDVNGAGNFSGGTVVSGIDTSTNVGVAIARGDYLYSNDGSYLRNIIGHSSTGSIDIGHPGTGLITDIKFFPGSSGNILFYASGSENMRVASSGNVGIGTTSPTTRLDLGTSNTIGTGLGFGSTSSELRRGNSGNNVQLSHWANLSMIIDSDNNDTTRYFNVMHGANDSSTATELFRVQEDGNVGIGTTSPSQKLDVNGRVRIGDVNYSYGGQNFHIVLAEDTQDAYITNVEGYGIMSAGGYYYGGNLRQLNSNSTAYSAIHLRTNGDTVFENITGVTAGSISSATQRMIINSSGNVGIGTTSPGYKLDVNGNIRGTGTSQLGHLGCISTLSFGAFTAGTQGTIFEGYSTHSVVRTDSARLDFYMGKTTTGVGTMMSLTDTGRVGIGTTSPSEKLNVSGNILATGTITGSNLSGTNTGDQDLSGYLSGFTMNDGAQIKTYQSTNSGASQSAATLITENDIDIGGCINWWSEVQNGSFGTYNHAVFYHGTSQAGAIRRSGNTTVSYITSSDYRLKENVVEITDGIERVKQLKPSKFNFIGEDRIVDGFLAHEVQGVVPESISGEKDEVDNDGNPVYQGIDQSKIVPLLAGALKEAISKIEQLETRIQTLENKQL